jgi:hypothetical protein
MLAEADVEVLPNSPKSDELSPAFAGLMGFVHLYSWGCGAKALHLRLYADARIRGLGMR